MRKLLLATAALTLTIGTAEAFPYWSWRAMPLYYVPLSGGGIMILDHGNGVATVSGSEGLGGAWQGQAQRSFGSASTSEDAQQTEQRNSNRWGSLHPGIDLACANHFADGCMLAGISLNALD
jgi:hypothetical protein